jgi:hypothetical protein
MNKIDDLMNDPILDRKTISTKNDILLFKNETLKDFKEAQKKMFDKYSNLDENIKNRLDEFEKRINSYEIKITELSKLINVDKLIKEKIEELLEFKVKTNDKLLTEKIRLDNIRNDLKQNVTRIDKILTDSVIYPGIIGGISKYKTFHDLIDYVLTQCSLNLTFREKNIMDLKSYKTKLEGLIEVFNNQVNNILSTTSEYTNTSIKDSEERMKGVLSILEDRISEARIENANYAVGLEKRSEALQNEIKSLYTLKNDLNKKVDTGIAEMKKDNSKIIRLFGGYKKGFNVLEYKFTQLSEFIKDMRFRINLKEDVQRREFSKMSDLINFDKKKKGFYDGLENMVKNKKGFEGYLKEYISGKISVEELFKKYNSMNNINTERKSIGGTNTIKKYNSFSNNLIEEDKNNINNLLRGSMAMPRKKMSIDNDQIRKSNKKKHEEIKEVDEEDNLSNLSGTNTKKKFNLKENFNKNEKKEKDDFFEDLYEDVNVADEGENEKNNLIIKKITNNKVKLSSTKVLNTNINMSKSKHGRGSIRNNIANIINADKLIKNLKKLEPIDKEKMNINKKETDIDKNKKARNFDINLVNNNMENASLYSEINNENKNSNKKIVNSESNKNDIKEENSNNNKSSTLYNSKMRNISEMILNNNKNKEVESNDKFTGIKKDNKLKEKDLFIKKYKIMKNNLYDSEFILPSNLVHNATIIAYNSKYDSFLGNKKKTPEKNSGNISEIKPVNNLILTSFLPKNGNYDINI